jgi:hypothetical protein
MKINNKNQTTLKPTELPKEPKSHEGKPKFAWKSHKESNGVVPKEVREFIVGMLETLGESFFPNVGFKGLNEHLKFMYYIPAMNIVVDYLESRETDKEMVECQQKRDFCKRRGINRIPVSKYKYKNIGGWF